MFEQTSSTHGRGVIECKSSLSHVFSTSFRIPYLYVLHEVKTPSSFQSVNTPTSDTFMYEKVVKKCNLKNPFC